MQTDRAIKPRGRKSRQLQRPHRAVAATIAGPTSPTLWHPRRRGPGDAGGTAACVHPVCTPRACLHPACLQPLHPGHASGTCSPCEHPMRAAPVWALQWEQGWLRRAQHHVLWALSTPHSSPSLQTAVGFGGGGPMSAAPHASRCASPRTVPGGTEEGRVGRGRRGFANKGLEEMPPSKINRER